MMRRNVKKEEFLNAYQNKENEMLTKLQNPILHYTHIQQVFINNQNCITYTTKKNVNFKTIKRLCPDIYSKILKKYKFVKDLEIQLITVREHFPKIFNDIMLNLGLAAVLLEIRIERNRSKKHKKPQLVRDINYRELFGVSRALEIYPYYFDSIQ
jgi:hypothetical protein